MRRYCDSPPEAIAPREPNAPRLNGSRVSCRDCPVDACKVLDLKIPPERVAFLTALSASLALTPAVRYIARRRGLVAAPRIDRWHGQPTALIGGVAIFGAF